MLINGVYGLQSFTAHAGSKYTALSLRKPSGRNSLLRSVFNSIRLHCVQPNASILMLCCCSVLSLIIRFICCVVCILLDDCILNFCF